MPRAPRSIEIFDPDCSRSCTRTHLELEVLCSKGTYVRVLAEDIAAALGTWGTWRSLRRLYVEPFAGHTLHTLESLQALAQRGAPPPLLPIDAALMHLPAVRLKMRTPGGCCRASASPAGRARPHACASTDRMAYFSVSARPTVQAACSRGG